MRLAVISHKECWISDRSPSGYATNGGFPFQMQALSEVFDSTILLLPSYKNINSAGESSLSGKNLSVLPLTAIDGESFYRKLKLPLWLMRNCFRLTKEILKADAVHTPIPGDIGTIGMLIAFILRKPLFVRHCGNWFIQKTYAEKFWKWFMEQFAGGKNVMLATGEAPYPPSPRNRAIGWIFSTTLTEQELNTSITIRHWSLKDNPHLIIACRQEKAKGTGMIIESLPLIAEYFPRVMLDVVGDGTALVEFKRLADKLMVAKHVAFHGRVNHMELIDLLKDADLFCYPTQASEGFPKVVLEALACGLPIITTKVSTLPQLIGKGCGLLLEEATPKALATAVICILSNPEQYNIMSSQAIEIAHNYSLERWRDIIKTMLQEAWGRLLT